MASTVPTMSIFGLNAGELKGICPLCSYSRTQAVNHLSKERCGVHTPLRIKAKQEKHICLQAALLLEHSLKTV
jgi:hypothetical protein